VFVGVCFFDADSVQWIGVAVAVAALASTPSFDHEVAASFLLQVGIVSPPITMYYRLLCENML
jgi:hypothetical protein